MADLSNMLDYLESCWKSGYRAYEANILRGDCPFAKRSDARKSWLEGRLTNV